MTTHGVPVREVPESPLHERFRFRSEVVHRALDFLAARQLGDGCVTDDADIRILDRWDSVHALRAHAAWRTDLLPRHQETLDRLLEYLQASETPEGLISWGDREPGDYSTETSAEYITALADLGRDQARAKAQVLRHAQLPAGPWRENHRHIPEVFQTVPSPTAFALRALWTTGMTPMYGSQAVAHLLKQQDPTGHWGHSWYYNATPYYLTMPVAEALRRYGCYRHLSTTRTYVLDRQRDDGSWHFDMAEVSADAYAKQLSAVTHTVYALETLLSCGLAPTAPPVSRAVDYLLNHQRDDGSWPGGDFPYPPSEQYESFHATQHTYTTAAVLVVLRRWARSMWV